MEIIKVLLVCFAITVAYALPAGEDVLDKATANDVAANELSPTIVKLDGDVHKDDVFPDQDVKPQVPTPSEDGTFKPQPATTMFARLIDDIFNIPITVLQSVAKLLRNPFKQSQATPEDSAKY